MLLIRGWFIYISRPNLLTFKDFSFVTVVSIYNAFDNNFDIENDFTKYLKKSYHLNEVAIFLQANNIKLSFYQNSISLKLYNYLASCILWRMGEIVSEEEEVMNHSLWLSEILWDDCWPTLLRGPDVCGVFTAVYLHCQAVDWKSSITPACFLWASEEWCWVASDVDLLQACVNWPLHWSRWSTLHWFQFRYSSVLILKGDTLELCLSFKL